MLYFSFPFPSLHHPDSRASVPVVIALVRPVISRFLAEAHKKTEDRS